MITVTLTKNGQPVGSFNAETVADAEYDAEAMIRRGTADAYTIH